MARKNLLLGLTNTQLPAGNSDGPADGPAVAVPAPPLPPHGQRGAIGAVTRSIEHLKSQIGEARAIQSQLASGQAVVELDPAAIESSFVADRLPGSEDDHEALVASIREHGQQVPILVRPHPTETGRYQVAYGHRRLRAIAALGLRVRAVVRTLSDAELVVAQGQENTARTDLSFIERALFAARLEERGFDRETVMAALSVDKTGASRLISAAVKVPRFIIEAIGPAPKAGRDRWLELAERLEVRGAADRARSVIEQGGFAGRSSDDRFLAVFESLAARVRAGRKTAPARSAVWTAADGRKVARIQQDPRSLTLVLDKKAAPEFGDYVVSQLGALYAAWLAGRREPG